MGRYGPAYNGDMTCRVIKRFVAYSPIEPSPPRVFKPGDVLENVDYASGEAALFSPHGDPTLYQLPIEKFKRYITVINF
jgi:hypothetical protein